MCRYSKVIIFFFCLFVGFCFLQTTPTLLSIEGSKQIFLLGLCGLASSTSGGRLVLVQLAGRVGQVETSPSSQSGEALTAKAQPTWAVHTLHLP